MKLGLGCTQIRNFKANIGVGSKYLDLIIKLRTSVDLLKLPEKIFVLRIALVALGGVIGLCPLSK